MTNEVEQIMVYTVQGGWFYEGFEILGIFTNREKAEKCKADQSSRSFDFINIEEYPLQ